MTSEPTFEGRGSRTAVLAGLTLLLACLALAAAPGALAAAAASTAPSAADPVVAQVLEMLRGGIAEPVIVLWLQKSGKRPAAVSSGDVVALHEAGASDELLKLLLTPAAGAAAAAAPAAQAPAPAPAPAAAPGGPGAASGAAGAPGAAVKVRFAVTYRPIFADADEPVPERWLLCLYVDGRFLASVKAEPLLVPLPPRTFERELAPGKHLLRVTQERHLRYSRSRGYASPARVDPSELPFELQAGAAAQIAVRFGEGGVRHRAPVAVRLESGGKEVARLEPAAPDPDTWPALCEDVPAALPAGAKLPTLARRDLEGCVHWAALWPGAAAVPSRDEVRAEIMRLGNPPGGPTE
jgi:hypothetical protein